MNQHLIFLWENLPNLLIGFPQERPGGLLLSIWLAVVALTFGFLIAIAMGRGRTSRNRPLRWLCLGYIELFRGLPLILLLFLVHQGLGGRWLRLNLTPYHSTLIALTLYTSAYQAEIIRAGLQGIPAQLVEAAKSVGASSWQIFWEIELRYVLRTMTPALTGQAISVFKDTSVVVVLGVGELLTVARIILGSDVTNTPYWVSLYILVGLLYMTVALIISNLVKKWERTQQKNINIVYSLANS